jgi:lipopolysaccharide export system permease protein
MPLLERYIFRRTNAAFLVTLGALLATLWMTHVLRELDVVTAKGQTIWVFVLMTALATPALAQVVAPIAFLVAVLFALSALNGDSELSVIAAAGAPRRTVHRPVIALAAILALALTLSHHVVAPGSLGILRELVTRVRADLIATLVKDGGFRTVEEGVTLHIREKAADGSFRGIFVSDERNRDESLQYIAEHGMLVEEAGGAFLVMSSGDLMRSDRASQSASVVAFDTYAFDLSQFTNAASVEFYKPRERSTFYLMKPAPGDSYIERFPTRARAELHERFTAPLYPFAFALIALAFVGRARPERQDRRFSVAVAAVICFSLRGIGFAAFAAASASRAAIPLLYLAPLAGIVGGSIALRRDARLRMPRLAEALLDAASALRPFAPRPRLPAGAPAVQER